MTEFKSNIMPYCITHVTGNNAYKNGLYNIKWISYNDAVLARFYCEQIHRQSHDNTRTWVSVIISTE